MKKRFLNLLYLVISVLTLTTGCNLHKPLFMEIRYCTDAFHLPANSLYPEYDLSQMKRISVYKYIEDKNSLYERAMDFADKLLIDISKMTDESDGNSEQVRYISNNDNVNYKLSASENSVELYFELDSKFDLATVDTWIGRYPFMLEYDIIESGFVLSEDIVQLYKDSGQELLKKLHVEDYMESNIDISIHPYVEDTDYLKNNDYTVTITLSYFPPKSDACSDTLLELYSLDSHISLNIVYFSKGGFRSATIRKYDSDWLNEVGQYEIIPYSEAQILFDNDDNVRYGNDDYAHDPISDIPDETWDYFVNANIVDNYDIYLVYVKDKEGYIRPLYMKQDYYKVGRMEGAAWIDAIDY